MLVISLRVTTFPVVSLRCCCSNFLFTLSFISSSSHFDLTAVALEDDRRCPVIRKQSYTHEVSVMQTNK